MAIRLDGLSYKLQFESVVPEDLDLGSGRGMVAPHMVIDTHCEIREDIPGISYLAP